MAANKETLNPMKESGYLSDFEKFLHSELITKTDSNVSYVVSEEEDNFDYEVFTANLEEEAHNFIEQPSSSNIFYPNIRNVERSLFKNNDLPRFKKSLRMSLESELNREDRKNFFGIFSPTTSTFSDRSQFTEKPFVPEPECISPDLFCSSSDEDELMPEADNCLQLVVEVDNDSRKKNALIADAEKFMIALLKDLVESGTSSISVVNCDKWENSESSTGILTQKDPSQLIYRNVNLKYARSRYHFALIMYVISEVYHLLITGLTCTERELYYNDPVFVENPAAIKSAIRDVCSILNASPWELGIRQSSKGFIAGAIKIHMTDNIVIDCYMHDRATLIPSDIQSVTFLESTARFVLIVEKDTIFEKLLLQKILLNGDIILITGKGYPDLSTRLMVKRIWNDFQLPIYVLVDADPFGIEIMFVYRYGSKAMAFSADHLACPRVRWIGIQPSEIEALAVPSAPQSNEDKKKLIELLQRNYISPEIRNELEILQRLGRKAEIEGVASFSANFLVCDYIPNKIKRNLPI